jgi:hypothetical protein
MYMNGSGLDLRSGGRKFVAHNSIFDSAPYGNLTAEWLFLQEEATMHSAKMATGESKML